MDITELIKISKEIQLSNEKNKEEYFEKKYPKFKQDYPVFFKMSCSQDMDKNMFQYITDMAIKTKNNKINNEDATIDVGQTLYNKYINPKLDGKKN